MVWKKKYGGDKVNVCDNASGRRVRPGCGGKVATYDTKVKYDDYRKDSMDLCTQCNRRVKESAKKYGYKVSSRRLRLAERAEPGHTYGYTTTEQNQIRREIIERNK